MTTYVLFNFSFIPTSYKYLFILTSLTEGYYFFLISKCYYLHEKFSVLDITIIFAQNETGRHQIYKNKSIRNDIFLELWINQRLSLNNVS